MSSTSAYLIQHLRWIPLAYAGFLCLLAVPAVQRSLIYLHPIKIGFSALDVPETVGLAPGKVRNFKVKTKDGETLGAWHVLPDTVYGAAIKKFGVPETGALPDHVFDEALDSHPTVLYFHGNAATRAAPNRVQVARHMSKEAHNFLIIDYRGFADSTGTPSEEGLLTDARRAWDYLTVDKSVPVEKITIMAQSLGTGVATGLTSRLAAAEIQPHALILVAPFSSISHLLEDYRLGNVIPVLSPLKGTPLLNLFLRFLHTKFDSKSVIHSVTCPILILHATDDPVIPHMHSNALVHHLLDPLLPTEVTDAIEQASNAAEGPASEQERGLRLQQERDRARDAIWRRERLGPWGVVVRFERGPGLGSITWGEAVRGKHNSIGTDEQSVRLIAETLHAVASPN